MKNQIKCKFIKICFNVNFPSIIILSGPISAGKTTKLIDIIKCIKKNVLVIKSKIDNRYHHQNIVSHNGNEIQALVVDSLDDAHNYIDDNTDIIAVDDAHFFGEKIINFSLELKKKNQIVILALVDKDHTGKDYFGNNYVILGKNITYLDLEKHGDIVIKLTANCAVCNSTAHRYKRIIRGKLAKDEPYIMVGGLDIYKPLCQRHFNEVCKSKVLKCKNSIKK